MYANPVQFDLILSDNQQADLHALSDFLAQHPMSINLDTLNGSDRLDAYSLLAWFVEDFISDHRLEFDAFLNDKLSLPDDGGTCMDILQRLQPDASRIVAAQEEKSAPAHPANVKSLDSLLGFCRDHRTELRSIEKQQKQECGNLMAGL